LEQTQARVRGGGVCGDYFETETLFLTYNSANGMQRSAFDARVGQQPYFRGVPPTSSNLPCWSIAKRIKGDRIDGAMLLQILDELIFEVNQTIVDEVAPSLRG